MTGLKSTGLGRVLLATAAAVSLVSVPVVVMADASAPWVNKVKAKRKMQAKPRVNRKKAVVRRKIEKPIMRPKQTVQPVEQAVEQTVQPIQNAVVETATAQTTTAQIPAAPTPTTMTGGGGSGLPFAALLASAGVIGLIAAAAGGGSNSPG